MSLIRNAKLCHPRGTLPLQSRLQALGIHSGFRCGQRLKASPSRFVPYRQARQRAELQIEMRQQGIELSASKRSTLRTNFGRPGSRMMCFTFSANAPSKIESARLAAALLDKLGTTVKPGKLEILDIDDTFCAAHGAQQLAFWNAHHDERGFASMHI
jgi:hypothetical protein